MARGQPLHGGEVDVGGQVRPRPGTRTGLPPRDGRDTRAACRQGGAGRTARTRRSRSPLPGRSRDRGRRPLPGATGRGPGRSRRPGLRRAGRSRPRPRRDGRRAPASTAPRRLRRSRPATRRTELEQAPATDRETVNGQGVEELVGNDDAGDGHDPLRVESRLAPGARDGRPFRSRRAGRSAGSGSIRSAGIGSLRAGRSKSVRRSPSRIESASVPDPAPYSIRSNGRGRPSSVHIASIRRERVQPKMGWVSGAVRKSPASVGRSAAWR